MNETLQKSIELLLSLKDICLSSIVKEFDDIFFEDIQILFEKVETSNFTLLTSSQITSVVAKMNALSSAIQKFKQNPISSHLQKDLTKTKESLIQELEKLNLSGIENSIEIPKINDSGLGLAIEKIYEKIEQEAKTRKEDFQSFREYVQELEKKFKEFEPIEELKNQAKATLKSANESLKHVQKTKTIEFSDKLSTEYESLQDLYRNTGLFWLAISIASFISIFCVLIHRKIDVLVPSTEIQSIFHDGFVSSLYALSPVFTKIGLILFFITMAGICLKIYFEYKRLSQEYRQKSLLAKNLLTGHEVLKPYIGEVVSVFVLPTIEKMLEDPLTKVYSKKESQENTLGLVEKIMELGKKVKN